MSYAQGAILSDLGYGIFPEGAWWPSEGWLSMLIHNYGGYRAKTNKQGITAETANTQNLAIVTEFPAMIVCLQEHDDQRRSRQKCRLVDVRRHG